MADHPSRRADDGRPRRRLRPTLGAAMLGLAGFAAALGWWVNRVHRKVEAVGAIERADGTVWYAYRPIDGPHGLDDVSPWPAWIRSVVGDAALHDVRLVTFRDPRVDRAALASVARLDRLRSFFVNQGGPGWGWDGPPEPALLADADLGRLAGLTNLHAVGLRGTAVTDLGLERLRGLTRLRVLQLGETGITDLGLAEIARHTGIKNLGLDGTSITDLGLEALRPLRALESLNLDRTPVSDAGLDTLLDLPALEVIAVGETRVTSAGFLRFCEAYHRRHGRWIYDMHSQSY